ncbi:hypothetical protein B566_EDAN003936 [Ephemera danica]|nr:hypothetical protein B566_EDAN003936 [Ephemera danica]
MFRINSSKCDHPRDTKHTIIATDLSKKYLTIAICSPYTLRGATHVPYLLTTYRSATVEFSESILLDLRKNIAAALKLQDLGVVELSRDC